MFILPLCAPRLIINHSVISDYYIFRFFIDFQSPFANLSGVGDHYLCKKRLYEPLNDPLRLATCCQHHPLHMDALQKSEFSTAVLNSQPGGHMQPMSALLVARIPINVRQFGP